MKIIKMLAVFLMAFAAAMPAFANKGDKVSLTVSFDPKSDEANDGIVTLGDLYLPIGDALYCHGYMTTQKNSKFNCGLDLMPKSKMLDVTLEGGREDGYDLFGAYIKFNLGDDVDRPEVNLTIGVEAAERKYPMVTFDGNKQEEEEYAKGGFVSLQLNSYPTSSYLPDRLFVRGKYGVTEHGGTIGADLSVLARKNWGVNVLARSMWYIPHEGTITTYVDGDEPGDPKSEVNALDFVGEKRIFTLGFQVNF